MQNDDFLTGCATTMDLSIKGQQLLARDIACVMRRAWRRITRWADAATPGLPRMHPPA